MSSIRPWLLALAFAGLAGCATTTRREPEFRGDRFEMTFAYAAFGAGPQPELGQVALVEGNEPAQVGDAITAALQGLGLSVVEPPMSASRSLPPDKTWSTDVAPLSGDDVAEYNRRNPASALPTDRFYGIQYAGDYAITGRQLRFRLASILHERGSGGNFRKYEIAPYASDFFFDRVRVRIVAAMAGKDTR